MVSLVRKISFPVAMRAVALQEAVSVSRNTHHLAGAVRRHRSLPAKARMDRRKTHEVIKHLDRVKAPRPSVHHIDSRGEEIDAEAMSATQRKPCRLFRRGDTVELWSTKQQRWLPDGEIAEVIHEGRQVNGVHLRAGSMRVLYDSGVRSRWVSPTEIEDNLRPSLRPRAPVTKKGRLMLETAGLFITGWSYVYVELQRGFLQWWTDVEAARRGEVPLGSVYTLGLEMQASAADASFKCRMLSSGDHVHKFNVGDATMATVDWLRAFHAHAGYCEDLHDYHMGDQCFTTRMTV